MFDYSPISRGLVSVIRQQVGSSLYQEQGQAGLVPAIFQDWQRQYKNYPYIVINRLSTREVGGWVKNISVDANDNTVYQYDYQVLYLISCFGENADGILTHLKQTFSFDDVRQKLYDDSNGIAVFQRSQDVVEAPTLLETDDEPMASMDISIGFTSTLADLSSTIITSAEIEGNLKTTDDSTPITKTFIVP